MVTTTQQKTALSYLDSQKLRTFDQARFKATRPFPWSNFQGFLTSEGFKTLYDNFPSLDLFEKHSGIKRGNNQRPHNRYYLAYENSIYRGVDKGIERSDQNSQGIVKFSDLPEPWQQFVEELNHSEPYSELIKSLYGVSEYRVRFAWHVGFNGCEVSPHVDSPDKIGTHIVYFNTSEDWTDEWGGAPLVLDGKQTSALNPDYKDFAIAQPVSIMDNRSFLFKNAPGAWHGVKPLTCPEGSHRRLFNIIFEFPPADTENPTASRLKALIPSPLRTIVKRVVRK